MKTDFQSLCVAEVEVRKVKFSKAPDLGIDFSNEIDAWAKMEFRFRRQIQHLRERQILGSEAILRLQPRFERQELRPLTYSIRQRID